MAGHVPAIFHFAVSKRASAASALQETEILLKDGEAVF